MQLFKLHHYLHTNPEQCWVVDFEFASMERPFLAIPYEISVRNIDGSSVFTSLVDWGCSANELLDAISTNWKGSLAIVAARKKAFVSNFRKHYGQDSTRGMAVDAVRAALWEAGWQHDKVLLSWSTSTDLKLLFSIIYDDKNVTIFRKEVTAAQQDVNIRSLLIGMLVDPSQETSLSAAHGLLCPGSRLKNFHTAHEDTLATCEILQVMADALPMDEMLRMGAEVEAGRYIL